MKVTKDTGPLTLKQACILRAGEKNLGPRTVYLLGKRGKAGAAKTNSEMPCFPEQMELLSVSTVTVSS